jgi:hypothetical protein
MDEVRLSADKERTWKKAIVVMRLKQLWKRPLSRLWPPETGLCVGGRLNLLRTRFDCAAEHRLVVVGKDVKAGSTAPERARLAIKSVIWVADHQHRSVD